MMETPPMRRPRDAVCPILIVMLLVGGNLLWLAESAPVCRQEMRGEDIEPNDDLATASNITGNDVVNGSLGITSSTDYYDCYRIQGGVDPIKVITATLYHVDYNESNTSQINFDVLLSFMYMGEYETTLSFTSGTNRTETAVYCQDLKFDGPEQIWAIVMKNNATMKGRYQLTVNISDPPELGLGQVSKYLSDAAGPQGAYYRLSVVDDNTGYRVRLQSPSTGSFILDIFNNWSPRNEWWFQNGSWDMVAGGLQETRLVGMGGTYYVFVLAVDVFNSTYCGNGTYTLTIDTKGGPEDDDNFPSDANIIDSNNAYTGHLATGIDTVDWWRVDMKAGKTLRYSYLTVPNDIPVDQVVDFAAFDKDLNFLSEGYSGVGALTIDLGNFTTNYTGPLYFAVRAGWPGPFFYHSYYLYGACTSYTLQFQLPNDPPLINGTIPDIVMDEDTSDNSLVLSEYIWDQEGNHINYSLTTPKPNITTSVDRETGRVSFTPKKDWYGMEAFNFAARDNGPGQKSLTICANVTVNPVNDIPMIARLHNDTKFPEESEWETADLYTIFSDVDDMVSNLTFGCRVISSTTHPPAGELPIKYKSKDRAFILGPAHLMYGNFELELNCTDNHAGTLPVSTSLNVTITHVNHDPALKENITSPLAVSVPERGNNSELLLNNIFTDPDLPAAYASDALTYTVMGMTKLTAAVTPDRKLMISAGKEQYRPGFPGIETLTVTATDKAGRTTALQVVVTVEPVNDPPEIISHQPNQGTVTIKENEMKVFTVSATDVDTETRDLAYRWYLDGIKDPSVKESSFTYQPDYSQGGQEHKIRAEVSDGTSNISYEWVVKVTDVNRPPDGTIRSPANLTKSARGSVLTFTAEGSDTDGDNLTYTWRDAAGNIIGTTPSFTYSKLPKGMQTIRLEINDGKESVYREVTVTINEQQAPAKKGLPGFEAATFMIATGICIALLAFRRRH